MGFGKEHVGSQTPNTTLDHALSSNQFAGSAVLSVPRQPALEKKASFHLVGGKRRSAIFPLYLFYKKDG